MEDLIKLYQNLYNIYGDKYTIELSSEGCIEISLPGVEEEEDKPQAPQSMEMKFPQRESKSMIFNQ